MISKNRMSLGALVIAAAMVASNAGCGDSGGQTPPPVLSVTASAASAMVPPGGMDKVTATVSNDSANQGVSWSVTCAAAPCGTVSPTTTASGVATTYTAPAVPPVGDLMVTVTAASVTNGTATGSANITIPGITVSIAPLGPVTLESGAMQQFTATVNQDPGGGGVNWSMLVTRTVCAFRGCHRVTIQCPVGCGILSSASTASGAMMTYTAPPRPPGGTVPVIGLVATSVTNGGAQSRVDITVLPISVSVAPPAANVAFNGVQPFTATVTNDGTMSGVNWSLTQNGAACSPGCGTVSPTMTLTGVATTYTGPAMAPVTPDVTLTATSVEDGTKRSSAAITVPVISVSVMPTTASVVVNAAQMFTATVMNDVTNSGVAWTLTQNGVACSPGCGTVGPTPTPSGVATTYTAPAVVPALPTVTLTATSVTDGTKTAIAAITVTTASGAACGAGSGSESLLKGQYAFLLQGFDANGDVTLAGSFTADGAGKITGGEEDITNSTGGLNVSINATGSSYSVGPDHRGCLVLVNANAATTYFRFALGSVNGSNVAAKGHIIEFDDLNGAGTRVAGTLRLQDPASFQATQFQGNYAFGLSGRGAGGRFALAGTFASDGSTMIISGVYDVDDGGTTTANVPLASGLTYACCSANGRGTLQMNTSFAANLAFYMISSSDALLVNTLLSSGGEAIGIPAGTTFTNASLNGVAVIRQTAQPATGPRVDISTATADGVSSLTLTEFENNAGTFATNTPPAFTYSVAANGRVTLTGAGTPVLYLSGPNQGFLVGTTADADFGIIEPQASGPFSNASLSGAYTLGTENPSAGAVTLKTGVVNADGFGNAPGTSDQSSPAGLTQNQAVAPAYSIMANGTGTFGNNTTAIAISANKLVFIDKTTTTPAITVVERPVVSISFSGGNAEAIGQGASATITAGVLNDPSGMGVTWTLMGPGTLSNRTSTSVQYSAPGSVGSSMTVTVIATSVTDPNVTATFTVTVNPTPALVKLSSDPFTNSTSQHATEVEPDTFAFGSTIVSTFQVGRIFSGASADVGFATSTNGGVSWTHGLLPGITIFQGGTFDAAGDPSVAYDAKHGQWIINTISVHEDASGNPLTEQILVSRSPDGITWGNPIAVNPVAVYDKNWIVCDNTSTSPFYGHCYVQFRGSQGLMMTSTSIDGGLTWQAPLKTADMVNGFGGQPVVQPNGTVISPMVKFLVTDIVSFTSTDGGASWNASTEVSPITYHTDAGNMRSGPIPSAEIDAAGTVYLVWGDCRFRTNCSTNDLILSTSSDGVNWTSPARIPIDPVTSTVDHFIPGLAVDRTTSGNTAHLTLTYYYFPVSNCGTACKLYAGYVTSQDSGQTWSAPVQLAGPMQLDWLPNTLNGFMVGDYISGSYVNGNAFAVFAVAAANVGSVFDEAMYTTAMPMILAVNPPRFSSEGELPVPNAKSNQAPRETYPERRRPPF